MVENINKYPHITFRKKWELKNETIFELGQCESIIRALSDMPIPPAYRTMLMSVSLKKGAQATTAIEGNTLTDEEITNLNVRIATTYKILSRRMLMRDIKELINLELLKTDNTIYWANIELLRKFIPKKTKGINFCTKKTI